MFSHNYNEANSSKSEPSQTVYTVADGIIGHWLLVLTGVIAWIIIMAADSV